MESFPIRRDVIWRIPLLVIAATRDRSVARLTDETIDIRFGIARVQVPLDNVASVRARDWSWLLGVGIRIASDETLGLIGSTDGVVQIGLREPTVDGVLFMRRPRNVAISLEDPAAFIEAVERLRPQSSPS